MIDRRPILLILLCAPVLTFAAGDAAKSADTSDKFFSGPIPHFTITLDDENLKAIRQKDREYVHATVIDDEKTFADVGFHLKGAAGSYRPFDNKPALTLSFGKFVGGRRYHAIDKLHLNNSVQDPAYLTEIICGGMFLKAGVPAARGTHAIVELQGRKRGLYVLKEGFDRTFLKHFYKNTNGNLYDGGFLTDIDGKIKKSLGNQPIPDHSDVQALATACREPDLAKRAERINKLLDVDRFLSLVALEVITWHWDGYGMKANNYRVYHDPDSDKITIFPHGMDQMFWDVNGTIDPPSGGLIARRMFQMPEYRERYYARLAELRRTIFVPDALDKQVDERVARLKPVLEESDRNLARSIAEHAKNLKARMRQRADAIDRQLAARTAKN